MSDESSHLTTYVLLVHRAPGQVARLVRRLNAPGVRFIIHVDPTSDIQKLLIDSLPLENVEFLPRRRARWASFGLVAIALDGLRRALNHDVDHVVLLSGQDYPIKPAAQISRILESLGDRSLLYYRRFPNPDWPDERGGFGRIDHHYLWTSSRFARAVPRVRTGPPHGLTPYGGRQWWALSRCAAEWVLDEVDRRPAITRYFRTTLVPDELLFQTLLLNSAFADRIVNQAVTFADWSDRGERKPAVLRATDVLPLHSKPHLFARKFDEERFPGVLDLIDRELLGVNEGLDEACHTVPLREQAILVAPSVGAPRNSSEPPAVGR